MKIGSNGDEVKALQEKLNNLGFNLVVDGDFGKATHNAVVALQAVFGYDIDGVAGPATLTLLESQSGYGWHLEHARKAYGPGSAQS